MTCPQCGVAVAPGHAFCANCGTQVTTSLASASPQYVSPMGARQGKSKVAAGLLQIFLGGFGAGRFYTGHTGMAIAQIAVTWLTCGVGGIWPFVDGILMLSGKVTDSDGRPLVD